MLKCQSVCVLALVFTLSSGANAQQFIGQSQSRLVTEPVHRVPHRAPAVRIVEEQVVQTPVRTYAEAPAPGSYQPVKPTIRQWSVVQIVVPAGFEPDEFGKLAWKEEQVTTRWIEVTPQPNAESKPIRHTTIYPNWDAELERMNSESDQGATPESNTWQPIRPRTQLPADEQSSELPRYEFPKAREPVPAADQKPSLQQQFQPKQRDEGSSIRYTGPSTLVRLRPVTP